MICSSCGKDATTITARDGSLRKHTRPIPIPGGVAATTCSGSGTKPVPTDVPEWIAKSFGEESGPMNTPRNTTDVRIEFRDGRPPIRGTYSERDAWKLTTTYNRTAYDHGVIDVVVEWDDEPADA